MYRAYASRAHGTGRGGTRIGRANRRYQTASRHSDTGGRLPPSDTYQVARSYRFPHELARSDRSACTDRPPACIACICMRTCYVLPRLHEYQKYQRFSSASPGQEPWWPRRMYLRVDLDLLCWLVGRPACSTAKLRISVRFSRERASRGPA